MNILKILILLNSYFKNKFNYICALINDKLYFDYCILYYHMNYLIKIFIAHRTFKLTILFFFFKLRCFVVDMSSTLRLRVAKQFDSINII